MEANSIRECLAIGLEALRLDTTPTRPMGFRVSWPEFTRTRGELFVADIDAEILRERITITRLQAGPESLDMLTRILPWLYSIGDLRYRKATFLRHYYPRIGWRRVAGLLAKEGYGCSHETARRWEREGIERIEKAIRYGLEK